MTLSQSVLLGGALMGGFILYLARKDRIKTYLGFLGL